MLRAKKPMWTLALILGASCSMEPPPSVLLEIRDPEGLAMQAAELSFGTALEQLNRAELDELRFPTRATLTSEEGGRSSLVWVEARNLAGEPVARGRVRVEFPEAGSNTAAVDLRAVCSRSGVVGRRCSVNTDEIVTGICALGRCVEPRCGDGIIDSAAGEACDDGELLVCAERQLEESEESCIARLESANDGCDRCRFTEWVSRTIVGLGSKGGPAEHVPISNPRGLDIGPEGQLFFGANDGSVFVSEDANGESVIVPLVGVSREAQTLKNTNNAAVVRFTDVNALDVDSSGLVYVAAPGTLSTNAGVFRVDPSRRRVQRLVGGGGFASEVDDPRNLLLTNPAGLVVNGRGEIFIADRDLHVIWRAGAAGITRIAGMPNTECTPADAPCGEGGSPRDALLSSPACLEFDAQGDLLLCASGRVQKIELVDGEPTRITTVAGNGTPCGAGPCGDGGAAVDATVDPVDLATTSTGEVLILQRRADLRRIDVNGRIDTIAGTADGAFGGDGGPALQASFNGAQSVAVGDDGSIVIADTGNHRIRRLVPEDTNYLVETSAGTGRQAGTGDGGLVTSAQLDDPRELALVAPDRLLVLQGGSKTPVVRSLTDPTAAVAQMEVDTVIGGSSVCRNLRTGCEPGGLAREAVLQPLSGMAVDREERRLFLGSQSRWMSVNYESDVPEEWTLSTVAGTGEPCRVPALGCGDGGQSLLARVNSPSAMVWIPPDTLLVAQQEGGASRIRRVLLPAKDDPSQWTIDRAIGNGDPCEEAAPGCGDGGLAQDASFTDITGLLYAETENRLYIVDRGAHRVRRVALIDLAAPSTWEIETWLGSGQRCVVEENCQRADEAAPGDCGAGGAALDTDLTAPTALVRQDDGVFFLTDTGSSRVARIEGDTLNWVAGTGRCASSGDGGLASGASFARPEGLEIATDGTLFVSDTLAPVARELGGSGLVRRIEPNNRVITTVVGGQHSSGLGKLSIGQINQPLDFVLDGDGIVALDSLGGVIVRVNEDENTLLPQAGYRDGRPPGFEPSDASLTRLGGVLSLHERDNMLFVGTFALSRCGILEIDTSVQPWRLRVLAGSGDPGFSDGSAEVAQFRAPAGITDGLDAAELLVADSDNHVLRRVDLASGAVSTALGTPEVRGFAGDGPNEPGKFVRFNRPTDVVNAGSVAGIYILDTDNHRVRRWAPDGELATVLGTGEAANASIGRIGSSTSVFEPFGLAVGPSGDLAVAARDALWLLLAGEDRIPTGEDRAVRIPLPPRMECVVEVEWSGPDSLVVSDGCTGELVELQRSRVE